MAKAMRKYFHEYFDGAETSNIWPSESFTVYGNSVDMSIHKTRKSLKTKYKLVGYLAIYTTTIYLKSFKWEKFCWLLS